MSLFVNALKSFLDFFLNTHSPVSYEMEIPKELKTFDGASVICVEKMLKEQEISMNKQ